MIHGQRVQTFINHLPDIKTQLGFTVVLSGPEHG
jgi:hypothetical protein